MESKKTIGFFRKRGGPKKKEAEQYPMVEFWEMKWG
jgi:hypothetical protein